MLEGLPTHPDPGRVWQIVDKHKARRSELSRMRSEAEPPDLAACLPGWEAIAALLRCCLRSLLRCAFRPDAHAAALHSQIPRPIRGHTVQVSILYTAPTLVRSLMQQGDAHVTRSSRASLRLLGSVGEPISPEAWRWLYNVRRLARALLVFPWVGLLHGTAARCGAFLLRSAAARPPGVSLTGIAGR